MFFVSDHGCPGNNAVLRLVPRFEEQNLDTAAQYFDFLESVTSLSRITISSIDALGKHTCSTCRLVLSNGVQGTRQKNDAGFLKEAAARCLVDFICYALKRDAINLVYFSAQFVAPNEVETLKK